MPLSLGVFSGGQISSREAPSQEALVEQGLPTPEAHRLAVRSSLQAALEVGFERWGKIWLCAAILLVLGMFGVLIVSQWIYDTHRDDPCDQPFALMLRILYVITAVHAFQKEITKHILCYNGFQDGPVEPCRVVLFRRASSVATVLWPLVATYMLTQTKKCSSELKLAIQVITAYYALVLLVAIIIPACLVTVLLFLIRHGLVPLPRSRHAAPDDLIDQLPKVEYDPAVFDDEGAPGCHPSACPICLDGFSTERSITKTFCAPSGHAFHTDCLQGWLQCAKTCPLCRLDLTTSADPEMGMELTS